MTEELTLQAQEARRNYKKQYRAENRERINAQQRKWRRENRDKVQQYNENYWQRVAEGRIMPRKSWQDYGISKERYQELRETARTGESDALVLSAALRANEGAAGHIILSVTKGVSYNYIEFHDRLGRCPLGRTNFYAARRLFYHYLDCALKEVQQADRMEAEQ